jgi:hypothetical protein
MSLSFILEAGLLEGTRNPLAKGTKCGFQVHHTQKRRAIGTMCLLLCVSYRSSLLRIHGTTSTTCCGLMT